jgi:hypothetical protein
MAVPLLPVVAVTITTVPVDFFTVKVTLALATGGIINESLGTQLSHQPSPLTGFEFNSKLGTQNSKTGALNSTPQLLPSHIVSNNIRSFFTPWLKTLFQRSLHHGR